MHILILPSWYPAIASDITGVFFRDQALALSKYGHKVGVVSPQLKSLSTIFKSSDAKEISLFENDGGVLTYRIQKYALLPKIPYGNYYIFKNVAKKLVKQYISENGVPDIIHAHSAIYGGVVAKEIARKLNIPFVITEHNSGFARKVFANWQLEIAKNAFDCADSCITVSPNLGSLISKQMPGINIMWQWVPNVVADRFNINKNHKQKGAVRFLNLALMTRIKGQSDLLKAFRKVINSGANAELWFGGNGPEKAQLEIEVKSLGLEKHVRFLGMIEPNKVPNLLNKIDIMVISSHYETFGVVAIEALIAGVPVVATRCGGPECIVEEGDGELVSPKNPDSLSRGMLKVMAKIDQFEPDKISKKATSRFSGNVIAKQLTDIYISLVNNKVTSNKLKF